jgi:SAM-dependent methyltransferase
LTESNSCLPRGAVVPSSPITADDFDRAHGQAAKSDLLWRVSNGAYGADCPTELQAWGMTTWWTLGRFVSGLRLSPADLLLDLACGRGGVGLWLARALNVRLVGVDWSGAGVRGAADRTRGFVAPGRARFQVGELTATGLDPESADGAICADAVFFASDRRAVFAEMGRVLRPGGRFLFTADESDDPDRPAAVPDCHSGRAVVIRRQTYCAIGLTRECRWVDGDGRIETPGDRDVAKAKARLEPGRRAKALVTWVRVQPMQRSV